MSRTAALWTSAIVTIAFVLIVGAVLLRPNLSQSATAQQQADTTLVNDPGASQIGLPVLQQANGHEDDYGEHEEHHDSDTEHDDDD